MLDLNSLPITAITAIFVTAALVIALAGTRMTRLADRLADLTGLGEAIFGAVLLGGITSLPGILTSVVTAYEGYAELAISNAVGGIAAQTAFLAIADIFYRRANLEHAAASVQNLMQSALLAALLAMPLIAMTAPAVSVFGVSPVSIALVAFYVFGIRLVADARRNVFWYPHDTSETRIDEPEEDPGAGDVNMAAIWVQFGLLAAVVAVAGYAVAQSGIALADSTNLSQSVIGGLFTAVATSLPELVISIAAVRRGALTLAVGGIIGGNCFDVLFIAFADVAYREGSIYHAMTDQQVFIIALTLLLNAILLLGLLRREKSGIGNIGFESFMVLLLYAGAFVVLGFAG